MDIKLRKWKSIISFTAFFLSVSLLIDCGVTLCSRLPGYILDPEELKAVWEQDYQKMNAFRSYAEERFSNFLTMAVGGELGFGYYDGYYGDSYETSYEDGSQEYPIEGWFTGTSVNAISGYTYEGMDKTAEATSGSEVLPEAEYKDKTAQNKKDAEAFHKVVRDDRNLLYRISFEGKELYSNMEGDVWKKWGDALPEGYNFLLYYDGKKASILKDGEELDVYGDGFYEDGTDWYLPGYKNFTADKEAEKAEIVMLFAEKPISYTYINYSQTGYSRYNNDVCNILERAERRHRELIGNVIGFLAGACLFVVYLFLRREKKTADQFLGRVTGKIWFEAKLLVWLVAVVICIGSAIWGIYDYWGGMFYFGAPGVFGGIPEFIGSFFSALGSSSGILLPVFWLIYLTVNDIKRNRGTFYHGIISRAADQFETKSMKLAFSKRMVRRFLPVLIVSIVLSLAAVLLVFYLDGVIFEHPWLAAGAGFLFGGIFLLVCYWYIRKLKSEAKEIDALTERIRRIHDGIYEEGDNMPDIIELKEPMSDLDGIRQGMQTAIDEQLKSERMKVALIANVSHDIKTPLTSIISYVQFLKQEEGLPEHVRDYIRILDEKSERLKNMVQDVFNVSKAASGELPVELEKIDFGKLLRQTLADMDGQIQNSPVTVKAEIPEYPVYIIADGQRMYRVFQNLIQNALRYSLEGSRIFITLEEDASMAVAGIKNTSRQELAESVDFTERFTRGDESRTDGGSGLGLSIAKSFTEACGGRFELKIIADLFTVTVAFKKTDS